MKLQRLLVLLACLYFTGCAEREEKEIVSAYDVARAMDLVPAKLQLPEKSYEEQELYFFLKERSNGRSDWFYAFQTPGLGGTVKFLSNTVTREIKILNDDEESKSTSMVKLMNEEYEHSGGWPTGMVKAEDYFLRFSDSREGLFAADRGFQSFVDKENQQKAEEADWVRFFSGLGELGSISVLGTEEFAYHKQILANGEALRVEILNIKHTIPATMYLPFYRKGLMSASLRFKATTPDGIEIIDSVGIQQELKKYGFFLIPDFSLKEDLNVSLRDTLIKGIEMRIKEDLKRQLRSTN